MDGYWTLQFDWAAAIAHPPEIPSSLSVRAAIAIVLERQSDGGVVIDAQGRGTWVAARDLLAWSSNPNADMEAAIADIATQPPHTIGVSELQHPDQVLQQFQQSADQPLCIRDDHANPVGWLTLRSFQAALKRMPPPSVPAVSQPMIAAPSALALPTLLASEARLRRLVANVPGMIYQYTRHADGSESFPFVGYNCLSLFELEPEQVQAQPELLWARTHPEDQARFRASVNESAQTLSPWALEWRIVMPSGQQKWVQGISRPQRYPNGDLTWDGVVVDISDRKRLEAERDRFFKLPLDILGITDFNGCFRQVNPAVSPILGYEMTEFLGEPFMRLVHPGDYSKTLSELERLTNGTPLVFFENRYRCKDGSYKWLSWKAVPVPEEELIYVVGRDITTRKRVEEALQRSRDELEQRVQERTAALQEAYQQLTFLIENSPLAVIEWNRDFQVQSWSSQAEQIFGWSRADVVGRRLHDWPLIHPDDQERVTASLANLLNPDEPQGVCVSRSLTQQGNMIHCEWYNSALIDEAGNLVSVLSLVLDVTDRTQAEQSLRDSEALYRTLIQNFPNGTVHLFDLQRRYLFTDGCELAALAMTREQFEGKTLWEAWPEPIAETLEPLYQQALAGQEVTQELVIRQRTYMLYLVPVHNDRGQVVAGLAMTQNITARKRMEAALIQARDELETRIIERTKELAGVNTYLQAQILEREQLTQQLARSNQELEKFAYIASHDLQEPLRAITSYTQLLARKYEGQLDDRAAKYIGYVVDGATRMQQLITDLLAYSRVGRHELKLESIDSNEVMQRVLRNLHVAIAESQAHIIYEPLPPVVADPGQLTQLLQNLIGNAIKYCDRTPTIQLTVTRQGHEWLFSIRDNGIGIEAQYVERIFAIFQRLHTRRHYSGTGIGLAICQKIVERHQGRIWVDSEPDVGSTFYFTLPTHPMGPATP